MQHAILCKVWIARSANALSVCCCIVEVVILMPEDKQRFQKDAVQSSPGSTRISLKSHPIVTLVDWR